MGKDYADRNICPECGGKLVRNHESKDITEYSGRGCLPAHVMDGDDRICDKCKIIFTIVRREIFDGYCYANHKYYPPSWRAEDRVFTWAIRMYRVANMPPSERQQQELQQTLINAPPEVRAAPKEVKDD